MARQLRASTWLLVLWAFATTPVAARAGLIGFTFPDPDTGLPAGAGTDGFRFTPNVAINVTALGYYDRDQNGLTLTHPVAIYAAATQALLVERDVGPGAFLDGLFRWVSIAPLRLEAGTTYVLAGFHPGSGPNDDQDLTANLLNPFDGVMVDSHLTYGGYVLDLSAGLAFPFLGPSSDLFVFGPNLQFEPADGSLSLPEPAGVIPLGLGLAYLLVRQRRLCHTKESKPC